MLKKLFGTLLLTGMLTSCSQYALVNSDVYNDANLRDYHTFRIVTPDDGSLPPGMEMVTYYNIAAAIREQLVDRGFTEDPASPILVNIGLTVNKEKDTQVYNSPGTLVSATPVPVGMPTPPPQRPQPGPGTPPPSDLPEVAPSPEPGLALPANGPLHRVPEAQVNRPLPPAPGPVYNGMVPYYVYPRAYYYPGNTQIVTSVYREGVLSMDIVDMRTKVPLYSSSVATILDAGDTQFRNLAGIAQAVKVLFSKFPVPLLPQYKAQFN